MFLIKVKNISNNIKKDKCSTNKISLFNKNPSSESNFIDIKKIHFYIFILFALSLITILNLIKISKIQNDIDENTIKKINQKVGINKDTIHSKDNNFFFENKCHLSSINSSIKVIHFIITRFMIEFYHRNEFPNKLYRKDFIKNGIRVMKKYLFPSLAHQSCKNFTWILMIGDKINITLIRYLLNCTTPFQMKILYQKDIKNFVKNMSIGFDILITTRIDYDDRIYPDAVNDVRKAINVNKPMILYGYNSGLKYFEFNDKYIEFNYESNIGAWSVFISLILVLNHVKDVYTIYDLGGHLTIKRTLVNNYKFYGLKKLNYEPAIFDSGTPKFIWVQQKYSGSFDKNKINQILNITKYKAINFNLKNFYGT